MRRVSSEGKAKLKTKLPQVGRIEIGGFRIEPCCEFTLLANRPEARSLCLSSIPGLLLWWSPSFLLYLFFVVRKFMYFFPSWSAKGSKWLVRLGPFCFLPPQNEICWSTSQVCCAEWPTLCGLVCCVARRSLPYTKFVWLKHIRRIGT